MHNSFLSRLEKGRWYTFSQADVAECQPDLVRHNAESLCLSNVMAGLAIIALFFYPKQDGEGAICYPVSLIVVAIEFVICAIVFVFRKKSLLNAKFVNIMVIVSFVLVLGNSCYTLAVDHIWMAANRFLIFFVAFQIVFVYDFAAVILANIILASFFWFFARQHVNSVEYLPFEMSNVGYVCAVAAAFTWVSNRRLISEMVVRNRYHKESVRDQLTDLGNRRNFEQSVGFYTSVCRRIHQTVCVIMLDVDFFKRYNDTYLHIKGDEVLKAIGRVLKELSESEHVFAARVGGEEFIVLWTENRIAEAKRVARKLRQNIIDLNIPHETSPVAPYVTVSIGLYVMRGGAQDTPDELYKKADMALYRAKEQGRDRIVLYDSGDGSLREVLPLPSELNVGRR
jgi:diguanylate cyclase (GGDEF)-like protein